MFWLTSQIIIKVKLTCIIKMRIIYDRVTVLQVVHNRGHGFSKRFTLQGCATVPIHVQSTSQSKNMRRHDTIECNSAQCSGGHPAKLPVSKSAVFEDGPRVCVYGDESQRPESVTGRGYMAETTRT